MSSIMVPRQQDDPTDTTQNSQAYTASRPPFGNRGSATVSGSSSANVIGNPWGNNIWSNGVLGSAFDGGRNKSTKTTNQPSKTGSGLLAESSVPDRLEPTLIHSTSVPSRPTSQGGLGETYSTSKMNQNPAGRTVGGASRNSSVYAPRPPAINLTSGHATSVTRSAIDTPQAAAQPFFGASEPPQIFTKHTHQNGRSNGNDMSSIWTDHASSQPSNDNYRIHRNGSYSQQSQSSSRNNSLPPSRHGEDYPAPASFGGTSNNNFYRASPVHLYHPSTSAVKTSTPGTDSYVAQFAQMQIANQRRESLTQRPNSHNSTIPTSQLYSYNGSNMGNQSFSNSRNGSTHTGGGQTLTNSDLQLSRYNPGFPEYQSMNGTTYYDHSYDVQSGSSGMSGMRRDSVQGRDCNLSTSTDMLSVINDERTRAYYAHMALHNPETFHQMMAAYAAQYGVYNPYQSQGMPMTNQMNQAQIYHNSSQLAMQPVPTTSGIVPQLEGTKIRSFLLDEFKSNSKTSRRFELKDIYDHVVEFSGDQHGSRFIQQKLETANSDEKERLFREIQPNARQLMTDVFGNYVIQKFFEHGDQSQKRALAAMMKGHVLQLAVQMYACRVVQKAFEHILTDQQAELVSELEHHVLRCVKDQNGNHVIQKAIERCPPSTIRFILNAFTGQALVLSTHPYGCRVIQRCLEHCEMPDKRAIMSELHPGMAGLVSDQYGNYVVQHVVQHGNEFDRQIVIKIVGSALEPYSRHKFASNVVEKCLYYGDDVWRKKMVEELTAGTRREHESMLCGMIKDQFGNYVIQKLLEVVSRADHCTLVQALQPEMAIAKRSGCSKQVASIEKRMHRFGPCAYISNSDSSGSGYNASTGTTPPLLTADTQSVQTSYPPSMNGDATEGASDSRKSPENSDQGVRV